MSLDHLILDEYEYWEYIAASIGVFADLAIFFEFDDWQLEFNAPRLDALDNPPLEDIDYELRRV